MKKLFLVILTAAMVFSVPACQKKEEQPAPKASMPAGPIIDTPATAPAHGTIDRKTEFQVVVPAEVKKTWSAITFIIEDKKENSRKEVTVTIGDEFKIPDSELTVRTGPFLPHFKMSAQTITSASNNPVNPSIGVAIYKNGEKMFPPAGKWGWLYMNFPTIHSFQHERYGLILKEGIKKK
jgi:hypothetical protein